MNDLSDKAKIIYITLQKLGAKDKETAATSYSILDYIVEEAEELQEEEVLKDIPEDEFVNITIDINIKSINTLITSLAKKGYVAKTAPSTINVEGTSRNLRRYYLVK